MQISKSPRRPFSLASSFPGLPTVQFLISCKNYCIARWSKTGQWEGLGMSPPFPIKWPIYGKKFTLRFLKCFVVLFSKFSRSSTQPNASVTRPLQRAACNIKVTFPPCWFHTVATFWKGRASKSINFNSTITGTHSWSESAHAIGNSRFSNFNPLSLAFNSRLSMNWQYTTNDIHNDLNTNQTSID